MSAVLMTGCATEFMYNRLDTLASWYFEDLVLLNDDQRHELRDWLERTLAWHRGSELQRYATFIDELSTQAATPADLAHYERLQASFESYVDDLIDKTAPEASALLLGLSRQQSDELLGSLATKAHKHSVKRAKEVASNRWQSERRDDVMKQLKRWIGSVTDLQATIIASGVRDLEPTYVDWEESQQSWRNALQKALAEDRSAADTQQRVATLLREPQRQWTPAYAQKNARNRARYLNMLVAIDATLSAKQRTRLRDELRKLAEQLTHLAQSKQ